MEVYVITETLSVGLTEYFETFEVIGVYGSYETAKTTYDGLVSSAKSYESYSLEPFELTE